MNGLIVRVSVSVPNPGGIPDKQPFLICSVKFSICLSVSHIRHKEGTFLHLSKRLSKLASISSSFPVSRVGTSSRSFHCLNVKPNSSKLKSKGRVQWSSEHVGMSGTSPIIISAYGKIFRYWFLYLQQSSMHIMAKDVSFLPSRSFREVKRSLISWNAQDLVNLHSTISPFSLRTIQTFLNSDTNLFFSPSETKPILRLILEVWSQDIRVAEMFYILLV